MTALLIVGTDTDVGKTILTTALAAYWFARRSRDTLALLKLMQTGVGDCETYQRLFALSQPPETLVPIRFAAPLAPPIAAAKEGRAIDLAPVWQTLCRLQQDYEFVLVEALGGLGTPVTDELIVADLARDWQLEAVLVVPVRLGAIAQTVANVALARQAKVKLKGIILNCNCVDAESRIEDLTPIDLMEALTHLPVLGIIPYLNDINNLTELEKCASNLDLERLLPAPKYLASRA
ncbi:dethiobiotin synthase [Oscillatoria sp. FACHB-1406]|uniref:dethiobiotin synthase n=1 Tax=Oscillatoria sp. FACHB-1406 TaxID=2692846 RepID=UPI0016830F5E|nr:dethiobiotin synthase [Oscillatoria sp. FACHB-1406]MBD2576226.1 ATP-dependent dethiobiotin synthetase BioD [Oscillatoria sp. FACHB-1406]